MNYFFLYILCGLTIFALMLFIHCIIRKRYIDEPADGVLASFVIATFFWPMLTLILPKRGISSFFEPPADALCGRRLMRERDERLRNFWENPPKCSQVIHITSETDPLCVNESDYIEFKATDVESYIESLNCTPDIPPPDDYHRELFTLQWLKQRTDDQQPISFPEEIGSHQTFVDSLIDEGIGNIYCSQCQSHYSALQMTVDKCEELKLGWNFDELKCPNGHLVRKLMSIKLF